MGTQKRYGVLHIVHIMMSIRILLMRIYIVRKCILVCFHTSYGTKVCNKIDFDKY